MKHFSILLVTIMLIGCQAVPKISVSHKVLLYDEGFEGFENVTVESEKEKGSTFIIRLPLIS